MGTREIMGRISIKGDNDQFLETTSRAHGFIQTPAVDMLADLFLEKVLKVLEKYVVNLINWGEPLKSDPQHTISPSEIGEQIISQFITSVDSKDIVSVDYNPEKMPPIDGVYLTKRDYTVFTEKVEKIIGKIVKRSEDVVNLRGFVLDNTSDFELRIKEMLNICWQKFDDTQKSSLIEVLLGSLDRKKAWVTKQVETAKSASVVFEYANNDEHLLSISDRLDIFQAILPILSTTYHLPSTACPSDFKQYYIDKVNMYRNRLGHITFGEKTICIKGKDVEINQELHRLLRKNIAEVNSIICNIEKYLTTCI